MYLKEPAPDIQDQSLSLQYKAYAAIVYLRALRAGTPDPESIFVFGAYGAHHATSYDKNGHPDKYSDIALQTEYLVSLVTHAFKLIDREEVKRGWIHELDYTRVSHWFPTATERLDCRGWLVSLFVAMDLDVSLIDRAFPETVPLSTRLLNSSESL